MNVFRSRQIFWLYTLAPAAVVIGLAVWAQDFVQLAVARNPALNLSILGVIVGGVVLATFALVAYQREAATLGQFVKIYRESGDFQAAYDGLRPGAVRIKEVLRFLARCNGAVDGPMAQTALNDETGHFRENLAAQLSLPTFLSGFMIALGLFGTFIGLLETLTSTGLLIQGVANAAGGDANASVVKLIKGIQAPLLGMGTAFSASLFGLLGSLVLGAQLNALQALARRIRNDLRHFLDEVVVQAGERPAQEITRPMMSLGMTDDFLADFLVKISAQHKESVEAFGANRVSDEAVAQALVAVAGEIREQVASQQKMIDAQETLNRALEHQNSTMDALRAHIATQEEHADGMRRSHEDMVRVAEAVATGIDEVRRLVNEQSEIQGRVIQTERRTGELFEMLNNGIAALGDRDMILRDMQRSAIDAVKHASQIGVRINEGALSQHQAKVAMTQQIETALSNFADFKREQTASLNALTEGLRDLMRTMDRRNAEVGNLVRSQTTGDDDIRNAVTRIPQSLEAAHTSLAAQAELSKSLVSELRALREAGRR